MFFDRKSAGLIYRNVIFYRLAMWLLYRTSYVKKYQAVADQIDPGDTVVDLCCGECRIVPLLPAKNCNYIGLDINSRFVKWGQEKGYNVRLWDGRNMEFPEADVICIQSAFYHFIPHERQLLSRMLERARKKVIISEPVKNFKLDTGTPLARFGRWVTQVEGKTFSARFSEESLLALVNSFSNIQVQTQRVHRELVITLVKNRN